MTSWIRKLGFDNVSGGERGVITAINEQAKRISRTEFTMIFEQGNSRVLRDQAAHRETAHYLTWRDAVADLMAEPRTAVKYTNVFPDDAGW